MSSSRHERISRLFIAALELAPAERAAFLEQACGDDVELRAEVESLLANEQRAGELLATTHMEDVRIDLQSDAADSEPDRARFLPGTVLAGRYRMVSLLGRGGMGEVYRADDLKLGHTVALKFLPAELQDDPARMRRFLDEVRIALKVTHPNVCRVYDVGEVDGMHFIAMEYVDGEDLASLLRRVGRLPQDRAVRIARQLCSGLAAAHDQGVLHRDLKPGNVMIDGRGQARITDFGLAAQAESIAPEEVRSGTPGYMAPEQLAGEEVTVKSDVYALGLVLYELFTGQRAYDADSVTTLRAQQRDATPSSPSDMVKNLDPALDALILRCLEPDPKKRPPSALAVAAALPGGDPLAAALQAGETPAPEVVAAAGEGVRLNLLVGVLLLLGIVGTLVGVFLLDARMSVLHYAPVEKHPQVLIARAQEIIAELGLESDPLDTAYGFYESRYVWDGVYREESPDRWEKLRDERPTALKFWYRESPEAIVPRNFRFAQATLEIPPASTQRGVALFMDMQGRLIGLNYTPRIMPSPSGLSNEEVWARLFEVSELDLELFEPAEPQYAHSAACDERVAWTGHYPGKPDVTMHVEACALRGWPSAFWHYGPWHTPEGQAYRFERSTADIVIFWIGLLFMLALVGVLGWLVARNLRQGRGDRQGALRLAWFVGITSLVAKLLYADHVPDSAMEILRILVFTADAFLGGAVCWALYMAVEPFVRRAWPSLLVSWNRLLAGGVRDPRVGRDVLVGLFLGALTTLALSLENILPLWLGLDTHALRSAWLDGTLGVPRVLGEIVNSLTGAVIEPMGMLVILVVLRVVLRKPWLAVVAFVLLFTLDEFFDDLWYIEIVGDAVYLGLALFGLIRFGLLTLVAAAFIEILVTNFPATTDFSAWYAPPALFANVVAVLLALYCFLISIPRSPEQHE